MSLSKTKHIIILISLFLTFKVNAQNEWEYDYYKLLHTSLSKLDEATLRKVMLENIHITRKQYGLHELTYNIELEKIATEFAAEKNNKDWWNDKYPHRNSKWRSADRRIYETPVWNQLEFTYIDNFRYWINENLVTANLTIYSQMESLMNSPGHKEAILSKYVNSIGIGYKKGYTTLVHLFANFKK